VTEKTFVMLHNVYISNISSVFSTLMMIRNFSRASYHIRMISEGSYDTED